MSKLTILKYPDPFLTKPRPETAAVREITDEISTLISDMGETMFSEQGRGLAARQIGKDLDIIVVDQKFMGGGIIVHMINPIITDQSDIKTVSREGCLSIPGFFGEVERFEWVKVEYMDKTGDKKILVASGDLSNIVQHEIDHLHGTLFIDRMNDKQKKKLKGLLKRGNTNK